MTLVFGANFLDSPAHHHRGPQPLYPSLHPVSSFSRTWHMAFLPLTHVVWCSSYSRCACTPTRRPNLGPLVSERPLLHGLSGKRYTRLPFSAAGGAIGDVFKEAKGIFLRPATVCSDLHTSVFGGRLTFIQPAHCVSQILTSHM